ncbi:MAG TPA: ChbG/HpnK family deacetylase [Gemmataceae bacterium]|nr:ChbG/HpnK family deacetylase [Gemmataceae bacterium]
MGKRRNLVVVADDFGIGPETSRGIVELAVERRITATVLLTNSPYAADAVTAWNRAGRPIELGWHPNLTLDSPILAASKVKSLVDGTWRFHSLGAFLSRACTGRLRPREVAAELRAQYERFIELVGRPPTLVNSHQHVALFGPVGGALLEILQDQVPRPFVRRVREPATMLWRIPGAKIKRAVLSRRGNRLARRSERLGFPGCDVLCGITDPVWTADEAFYSRWLRLVPGETVELACHAGYRDGTLIGRDVAMDGAGVMRRVHELHLLRAPSFAEACHAAGFRLMAPGELASVVKAMAA